MISNRIYFSIAKEREIYGVGANRNRQESVNENKEKGGVEAELISKTISQKRFGSVVIPGLRLSKVTNKWNKRFKPEKAAESEEFRQTPLFF